MVTMKSYISEANEYKGESGWEGGQVGAIRFGGAVGMGWPRGTYVPLLGESKRYGK